VASAASADVEFQKAEPLVVGSFHFLLTSSTNPTTPCMAHKVLVRISIKPKKGKIHDKVLNLREPKPSATYLENWNSHT
jgi:hypothetical protein